MTVPNLYMSYTGVTFTPNGGSAVTIDEVTDIDWDIDGEEEAWFADGSMFPRLILTRKERRNVKVSGGNVLALTSILFSTVGSLAATLGQAVNGTGTGSGALLFTLNPCIRKGSPTRGPSGKFATADLSFTGYSATGTTDPLTIVAL